MFSESTRSSAYSSDRAIAPDQMDEIMDCILQGKYSSACLRLLEATGHNPLQYIPYRTYNRIQKQRLQANREKAVASSKSTARSPVSMKVVDLDYVESLKEKASAAKQGGMRSEAASFSSRILSWTRRFHDKCLDGFSVATTSSNNIYPL